VSATSSGSDDVRRDGGAGPDGAHESQEGPGLHEGLADLEAAGIRLWVGPNGRLRAPKGLDATCEAAGFDAAFVRGWLGEHNDALVALLRARAGVARLEEAVAAHEEDQASGVAERADIMLVEALTECGVDPDASVTPDEAADQVVDLAAIRAAARASFERESAGKTAAQCRALWEDHRAFWEQAMGPHAHELSNEEVDRVVALEADIEAAVAEGAYARAARLVRAWQDATTPQALRAREARGEAA